MPPWTARRRIVLIGVGRIGPQRALVTANVLKRALVAAGVAFAAVTVSGCAAAANAERSSAVGSRSTDHGPVAEEPGTDAFAGIDRCTDWFTPPGQPGFKLVVCNQKILKRDLNGASNPPAGDPRIVGATSHSPTAHDVPAIDYEPTGASLAKDRIVAADPTPVDVYVAYDRPRAAGQLTVLFRDLPASSDGLHVRATGRDWKVMTDAGRILRAQRPTVRGVLPRRLRRCGLSTTATIQPGGGPTRVLLTVHGPRVCDPLHSRTLALVLLTRGGSRPGSISVLNPARGVGDTLSVSIAVPAGTTTGELGLITRGALQLVSTVKLQLRPRR
jgi:hypothetical protein